MFKFSFYPFNLKNCSFESTSNKDHALQLVDASILIYFTVPSPSFFLETFIKKSFGLFVCPVEFPDLLIASLWGSLTHSSILCISYNLVGIGRWWMDSGSIFFLLIYQFSKIMNWFPASSTGIYIVFQSSVFVCVWFFFECQYEFMMLKLSYHWQWELNQIGSLVLPGMTK